VSTHITGRTIGGRRRIIFTIHSLVQIGELMTLSKNTTTDAQKPKIVKTPTVERNPNTTQPATRPKNARNPIAKRNSLPVANTTAKKIGGLPLFSYS
jgi:hypothetical protein